MAKKSKKKKPEAPVLGEIAVAGSTLDLGGYLGEIAQSNDQILKSLGGDLKHYETLLRDEQVKSTFQQRRRAVTSAEWEVVSASDSPVDKAAADFIREQLDHIRWDRVTDKMLYGVFYGYAVAECMWATDGNRITLDRVKVRKARRFRFGRDGSLRLLTRDNPQGVVMPERKFWHFSVGADNDDDLYGLGLGHDLYWPVFLKRNSVKFWAIALEKFGVPTTVGKYPASATKPEQDKLLAAAAALATDTAVVIPEGMMLDLIEATRRSGGDHAVFAKYMDAGISKVVLSQTMTTDDGSSRSQAGVHMDVRQDVVKGDADLTCESFNDGPVKWLTEWNFPGATPPKVWRIFEEPEDLKAASERDKTLHEMGFDPSEDYIRDKYGDGWSKRPPGKEAPDDAAFAEREPDAIEDLITDMLGEDFEEIMEPVIGPLREVIEGAASFEEAKERLAGVLEKADPDAVADALARSMFNARLAGELGIDLDGAGE